MEELILTDTQIYDMELARKNLRCKYKIPIAFFGKRQITFNILCTPVLKNIKALKWYATGDYIIGLPARRDDPNVFYVRKNTKCDAYATILPASMIAEKRIKQGCYYQVYKYRDGIAVKRFEPIDPYEMKGED